MHPSRRRHSRRGCRLLAGFRLPDSYHAPAAGKVRRPGSAEVVDIPAGPPEDEPYLDLEEVEVEA